MSVTRHLVRRGEYYDSVVLMRLQRGLAAEPGVVEVGVVMATPANLEILAASGLVAGPVEARPDDLLLAVRAADAAAAEAALGRFEKLVADRRPSGPSDYRPRSLAAAWRELPEARWALVSVPGIHAAAVARRALAAGRHVFLYSDNVSLADEASLKREAGARGLLVLGPDCGTARIGGAALGFCNALADGPVGLVGASGTGLQAISTRLDALRIGVSQVLGTGGRDLSPEVGGATALQALELLARDEATQVIGLISKPPAPEVAARVLTAARRTRKPVVVYFQGWQAGVEEGVRVAGSLEETALELARALGGSEIRVGSGREETGGTEAVGDGEDADSAPFTGGREKRGRRSAGSGADSSEADDARSRARGSPPGRLLGLFSGGTLATEAWLRLRGSLPGLALDPVAADGDDAGHAIFDLGSDERTLGKPHPMIDPTPVVEALAAAAADPTVGAVLLDAVLGHGAHGDPAAVLAPAVEAFLAAGSGREAIVVLVAAAADPQDPAEQRRRLSGAGARVEDSVDAAARAVRKRFDGEPAASGADPDGRDEAGPGARANRGEGSARPAGEGRASVPLAALRPPFAAVNVGLELFHDSLRAQGLEVLQVEWRPPAGGNERLAGILERLRD